MEIGESERAQLDSAFAAQYCFCLFALFRRNECHGWLRRKADEASAVIGRQPEVDFRAGGRIAPMAGQEKALVCLGQLAAAGVLGEGG
jgi:hypothetical protein